jgi:hypothetical protein
MDVQICSECNWPMEDSHYPLCWTCWRGSQGYKRIKSDDRYDQLQKVIQQLLQETPDVSSYLEQIQNQQAQLHNLKMELSQLRYEKQHPTNPINDKELKKLLMFCHPDRNPNRLNEAEEITKFLLSLRKK